MMSNGLVRLFLTGALVLVGCGGGGTDAGVDGATADASPDAASVDAARVDAGVDAGLDAAVLRDASVLRDAFDCRATGAVDLDGDGFTGDDGDCDDCDPRVNPGAIDVYDGTAWSDQDCSGTAGDDVDGCDGALALDDVDPRSAVRALDLCRATTVTSRTWGVIEQRWVRADGSASAGPRQQAGLLDAFGPNNHVQSGARMLGLSSGYARTPIHPSACGGPSCVTTATGATPPGFPWSSNACGFDANIADDVALEVRIRVPTNAVGMAFDFAMFSFEFPAWVCSGASDAAVVLMSPAPPGTDGQLVFDARHEPANNLSSLFFACDPTTSAQFAMNCSGACPSPPVPYCPLGASLLIGTGFDAWGSAGATSWLETTTPVVPGSTISLRFVVYDDLDGNFDTTALFDHVRWITEGTVTNATTLIASPR